MFNNISLRTRSSAGENGRESYREELEGAEVGKYYDLRGLRGGSLVIVLRICGRKWMFIVVHSRIGLISIYDG